MTTVDPERPVVRRAGTTTSAFGVGRRESHDATDFYARFTAPRVSDDETVLPPRRTDAVWVGDAREMDVHGDIADGSVALVVTSPPYFAGKEYEAALGVGHIPADYDEYLHMLHAVFARCSDKLEPGGRLAVNVANLGRKPYRSLSRDVIDILESLGLLLRGEIIWQKSHAAGGSCAWGTYQRPGNPVLRDITERIVVASKGRFDRAVAPRDRADRGLPHEGSMTMDEFVDATTDLWDLPTESATRIGHPAPFPVELPRRLIELYTYRGDLVLDPFMGSGSTAVAAVRTGRHFVGFDTDASYVALAERRVAEARHQLTGSATSPGSPPVVVPPAPSRSTVDDDETAMVAAGRRARDVALRVIESAGFTDIEQQVVLRDLGVEVTFRARDAGGGVWLFDLWGAYSSTRPGLARGDSVWRAIGKAAVLHEAGRTGSGRRDLGPLVLLTTDTPDARSGAGRALAAVMSGDGSGPVRDVVELLDPEGSARLAALGHGVPPAP
jgi:site-specific DNA-methyltransferase (adenine-specific)